MHEKEVSCSTHHTMSFVANLRSSHGSSIHVFHRAELIKLLYDSLGDDRRKIMTGKKVTDIISRDDGVRAICDDGSTYQGSIILGADGAHSKTRGLMRELAVKSSPNTQWDLELPYLSTYKCMFFCIQQASAPGLFVDTESKNRSVIYATSKHRTWVFLSEKLQQPTAERASYNAEDADTFAKSFEDYPVTKSLKIGDILSQKASSGMVNLEEGIVKHWSWGRIVLAGDSCHKFTPHAGLGFNNGVQDIVVLLNELRAVSSAPGHIPNSAELTNAFQSYQTRRYEPLKADAFVSALITRLQAWDNTFYYILARYIAPLRIWEYLLWNYAAPQGMKITPVLDGIPAVEPFLGAIEWENKLKAPAATGSQKS